MPQYVIVPGQDGSITLFNPLSGKAEVVRPAKPLTGLAQVEVQSLKDPRSFIFCSLVA